MMTFDAATLNRFAQIVSAGPQGMRTFDQATYDSLGAFVVSELERLDPEMHAPLVDYTWSRDIDLRTDITIGHEFTSFVLSNMAATGGTRSDGKSWAAKNQTETPNVQLDLNKARSVLGDWAQEISYTVFELASAALLQRPIDSDKADALQLKWNMDVDEQTYIGDTELGGGVPGLVNNANVTAANVANGASGTPGWATKTPQEILTDINVLLTAAWAASGYAVLPNRILLPPAKFAYIVNTINSAAGVSSILTYLMQNNIASARGVDLQILPVKWLVGRGTGGTDRMVAYTKARNMVRLPLVPFYPIDTQRQGIYIRTPYIGKIGQVEFVRTETIAYRDAL